MNDTSTANDTSAATGMVTVEISNSYACGRQSGSTEQVRYPEPGEALEDWWDDVVNDVRGDGHSCGSSERALYEAAIIAAPDNPGLVGEEWSSEG